MAGPGSHASGGSGAASPMGRGGHAPGANRPSMRRALEVFRYRHYRVLWASSTVSFIGMQMQQVARALLAWELTGSFAVLGAIALSFGLPMLLFSLIGGSLADRLEKRNLILMTQGSTAVFTSLTAILIFTDTITIELLFGIGLLQGTFFSFGMPARTPLMAEVVGPRNVMSAIAMSNASMNFTRLLGPAIAGVLAGFAGLGVVYVVMTSLYATSVILLLFVPTGLSEIARAERDAMAASGELPPRMMGQRPRGNMGKEIAAGLRYVWTTPRLRLLIAMMFVITMFAMPHTVLLAGYVQDDLGRAEADVGWLMSFAGVGALVASLAVATLTDYNRKPLVQWITGVASEHWLRRRDHRGRGAWAGDHGLPDPQQHDGDG
jgi:MFS family permease